MCCRRTCVAEISRNRHEKGLNKTRGLFYKKTINTKQHSKKFAEFL